jgi:hypothetical protein
VNPDAVYSRTVICWQLAFAHAGKLLHFLTSAVLMSLASAGLGFAWLCCWLDRFRSSRGPAGWMISVKRAPEREAPRESAVGVEVEERFQPLALKRTQLRTIDSLIRGKGARI